MFSMMGVIWVGIVVLWVVYWFQGGSVLKRTTWFSIVILIIDLLLNWRLGITPLFWVIIPAQILVQTITYWLGLRFLQWIKGNRTVGVFGLSALNNFRKTWPVDLACSHFLLFLVTAAPMILWHPVDDMPGDAMAILYVLGPWSLVYLLGLGYSTTVALPIGFAFSVIGWRFCWLWVPSVIVAIRIIQSNEYLEIYQIHSKLDITEAVVFSLSVLWASFRWFGMIRKEWVFGNRKSL